MRIVDCRLGILNWRLGFGCTYQSTNPNEQSNKPQNPIPKIIIFNINF